MYIRKINGPRTEPWGTQKNLRNYTFLEQELYGYTYYIVKFGYILDQFRFRHYTCKCNSQTIKVFNILCLEIY